MSSPGPGCTCLQPWDAVILPPPCPVHQLDRQGLIDRLLDLEKEMKQLRIEHAQMRALLNQSNGERDAALRTINVIRKIVE